LAPRSFKQLLPKPHIPKLASHLVSDSCPWSQIHTARVAVHARRLPNCRFPSKVTRGVGTWGTSCRTGLSKLTAHCTGGVWENHTRQAKAAGDGEVQLWCAQAGTRVCLIRSLRLLCATGLHPHSLLRAWGNCLQTLGPACAPAGRLVPRTVISCCA
jgi:hypothetical protein